jgi:hypothetical protein
MPFDRRSIEAKLALGRISPENMPKVAWDALEAGYDGPAVRRMAAFNIPTGFEVDAILPGFLQETAMRAISQEEAAIRVACDLAHEIIDSRKDPLPYAETFYRLWISCDYTRELGSLGTLPDDIYLALNYGGKTEDQVRKDIRDTLIDFIRKHETRTKTSEG